MNTKRGSGLVVFLILTGLILGGVMVITRLQSKNAPVSSYKTIGQLKSRFSLQEAINPSQKYWQDEKGNHVPLKGYEINLSIKSTNEGYMSEKGLLSWETSINNFFIGNSFIKNDPNTKRGAPSWAPSVIESSLAYTKGDVMCETFLNTGSSSFLLFFCGSLDTETLAWNNELSSIIPLQAGWKNISVQRLLGNFASGFFFVYGQPTSVSWIAVKENNKWSIVFTGQNLPSCKIMEKYEVPQEIYEKCSSDY